MGYTLGNPEQRKRELLDELDRITGVLRALDVEKVVLFGSLARGDVTSTSDIDLLVIQETDKGFFDRLDDMYSALRPCRALDILVYTPQEARSLAEGSSFVRRVLREGRVLYEKEPC